MAPMEEGRQPSLGIPVHPLVEAVGVARAQQGVAGHPMRAVALIDAQQGGRPFAGIRMRVMAHGLPQRLAFGLAQAQHPAMLD
jgi:hypothetical protein